MKCPSCGTAMTLLLVSYVCDRCAPTQPETLPAPREEGWHYGYIGFRSDQNPADPWGILKYVFRTPEEAIKAGYGRGIAEVKSRTEIEFASAERVNVRIYLVARDEADTANYPTDYWVVLAGEPGEVES